MITCPACSETAEPALSLGQVSICSRCGATLYVEGGGAIRMSRFSDLENLDISEMAQLRRARAAIARPERRQR